MDILKLLSSQQTGFALQEFPPAPKTFSIVNTRQRGSTSKSYPHRNRNTSDTDGDGRVLKINSKRTKEAGYIRGICTFYGIATLDWARVALHKEKIQYVRNGIALLDYRDYLAYVCSLRRDFRFSWSRVGGRKECERYNQKDLGEHCELYRILCLRAEAAIDVLQPFTIPSFYIRKCWSVRSHNLPTGYPNPFNSKSLDGFSLLRMHCIDTKMS